MQIIVFSIQYYYNIFKRLESGGHNSAIGIRRYWNEISAGLRVMLGAQKKVNARKAAMILKNVNEMVMEVFKVTGFTDILTIEA